MLATISSIITLGIVGILVILSKVLNISIQLSLLQLELSIGITFLITSISSITISNKLINIQKLSEFKIQILIK